MALSWLVLAAVVALLTPLLAFQSLLYLIRWYETANRRKDASTWLVKAIFARRMRPLRTFVAETFYSVVYETTYVVSFILSIFTVFRKPSSKYAQIDRNKPLIVLIHGALATHTPFWVMRIRFHMAGIKNVVTFSYPPINGDIIGHHNKLRDMILAYRKNTGITKTILVGHSFGGVIAFDYAKEYGENEVLGMVAMATPFRGSRLAVCGLTRLTRSLTPWNPRFGELIETQPAAPLLSIYSRYDQLVIPYTNSNHPKAAKNEEIDTCGHSGLLFDKTAFYLTAEWIRKFSVPENAPTDLRKL